MGFFLGGGAQEYNDLISVSFLQTIKLTLKQGQRTEPKCGKHFIFFVA